jgi:NitT/TauT family transport system substrate-binding protein
MGAIVNKSVVYLLIFVLICFFSGGPMAKQPIGKKERIKAIGIPLADHYAGIVAYEKYRSKMKKADYQLMLLSSPNLVRRYFNSKPDADIAFNVCPMVMDMFVENPGFKWVSLIHRDGNALAINSQLNKKVNLADDKLKRKPDGKIAAAIKDLKMEADEPIECAIPSPLATHTTVLYKYLKDHNRTMSLRKTDKPDVIAVEVKPPKSPAFLKKKAARSTPAAFEQSLPWPDLAESGGYGFVGWYSKDVMNHPLGHVECIIIAKDEVIKNKRDALKEVITFIHQAGQDIETARRKGGAELDRIITMIQKHIPQHTRKAIIESLRPDLNVINYKNLNVDRQSKESFKKIMDLAFEAGFIKRKVSIDLLADESFATEITKE